ncbi:MAG: hotdog domain-containing protein [Acidimicrobiales bacterium]
MGEAKLNARRLLQAGAITTIADVCIGHTLARVTVPATSLVTVHLDATFLGAVVMGDWVVNPGRKGARA